MFDFPASENIIAIHDMDGTVSYAELDRVSGILACCLADSVGRTSVTGPGPAEETVRISLILPRNRFYPIAVVATLKAGMAFNPVSSDDPDKRIVEIIGKVNPGAVITTSDEYERHKTVLNDRKVILIDRVDFTAPRCFRSPIIPCDADAMIIFTSGSSGKPKGVIHTRNSLLANARFSLISQGSMTRRIAAVLDFAFFVSNIDMISCLLNNGELHIPDRSITLDVKALAGYCSCYGITRVATTPQMAAILSKLDDPGVPMIVFGGSRACGIQFHDGTRFGMSYGSTESGINTHRFLDDGKDASDIGIAYDDVEVHVLDEDMHEVQTGETGELFICSPRIARAYLDDDDLTASKFIVSPLREGCTLYRTGDICRRDHGGGISFIGRSDRMIKHNAYRIHPEEVERLAETSEGVRAAQLVDSPGSLVLYYEGDCEEQNLYEYLKSALPAYMIPGRMFRLEKMPATGNGKPDRKTLESMYLDGLEKDIAETMAHILHTERLDIDDDFFRHGGDSMGVMELCFLLGDRNVTADDVIKGRSAMGIASIIRHKDLCHEDREQDNVWPESIPLVQFQRYVLETSDAFSCGTMWNTPVLFEIEGHHILQDIIKAVEKIINAHPLLKYRFDESSQTLRLDPSLEPHIGTIDIGSCSPSDFASSLIRKFDIHDAPLYRISLLISSGRIYLLLDFHHLISDGASIVLFAGQIRMALNGMAPRPDRYWEYAQSHAYPDRSKFVNVGNPILGTFSTSLPYCLSTGRTLTALCIAAAAKALPCCPGAKTPEITWTSHNRAETGCADSFGPILSRYAISVDISMEKDELISGITRDIEDSAESSRKEFGTMNTWCIEINNLCMIDDIPGFKYIPVEIHDLKPEPGIISIILHRTGERICIRMEYDASRYDNDELNLFFDAFTSEFENMLK